MTAATVRSQASLLAAPHHDGSDAYVVERPDEPGGETTVRLRVPRDARVEGVALRHVRDGEPRTIHAQLDAETADATWWRASFPMTSRAARYRWLLLGERSGYAWVNGVGVVRSDVADADDFVLTLDRGGPDWHLGSVVYEVFPDRFARSGVGAEPPPWAKRREWHERPTGRGPATPVEHFGGDLYGVTERLDHVESLHANVLYLTPTFPATSTHRYDATTFDRIDPLLGGDDAFRALVTAAGARKIRLVGDLTINHCGDRHEWFRAALADPRAPERAFFWFGEDAANGYESWLGVPSLPKLDWRSDELRRRMLAVVERWLSAGLDGWRIDVANMAGRLGAVDVNREVRTAVRRSVRDALLIAEHAHDFRGDVDDGDGWHGVMNYAGFLRPTWAWLSGGRDEARGENSGFDGEFLGLPVDVPSLPGAAAVATMRLFRAGVPWPVTAHSWTLVDSHDTARFRTVAGTRERQLVGVGLQMTSPGVPMVFAGDELGLEGAWGEDARRTMPWDDRGSWDVPLLEQYRRLIALRRSSDALARGGIRYAHVSDDVIAYLRETSGERLLCLATRAPSGPVRLPLDELACRELETLYGADATVDGAAASLPAEGPSFHVWRLHG